MNELLPQLLSFPPHPPPLHPISDFEYDKQIRCLVQLLNKQPASLLISGVRGGGDLLDILDPSINSLPYLFTLLAHVQAAQDRRGGLPGQEAIPIYPLGPLWGKIVEFLTRFDSRQVRYAGTEWRRLVELVEKIARSINKPIVAVIPIRSAILQLDPASSTLTSNHVLFARLCLDAKTFRHALPILERDIQEFPSVSKPVNSLPASVSQFSSSYIHAASGLTDKLTYRHHLEYHLFGALIYLGLKKWERGLEFLTFVIAAPTSGPASAIQVEAYKKWVLVGLLHHGGPMPLPRIANNGALKSYRELARAYDNFAEVFKSGNATRLREEFEVGEELWKNEKNYGLMLLVLDAFHRFNIRHLEDTYSTLSVHDICQRDFIALDTTSQNKPSLPQAHADETATEQYILGMIERGELSATLSHPPQAEEQRSLAMVHFLPGSHGVSEVEQLRKAEEQVECTVAITEQIKNLDRKLGLSKEYIAWMHKNKKTAQQLGSSLGTLGPKQDGGDDLEAMDIGWEAGIIDEDMMEDFEP
ncbi:hypothetical protein FGG08_004924 [Glutinoglossum americanum]|uniref:COP9 signalosome complex subunit 3 N-terminal helical repeats domain-containing protein n=1 Tax=Glutinoglossum americanum TaxID=1670608 RepID=A0A9P8I4M3_9PEZI|nr:hypothetical protein FGG08_004924 [Glutinoglossum americanum]